MEQSPVRLHHTAAAAVKSYIVSKLRCDLPRAPSRPGPQSRIDGQRTRLAGSRIEECAVIAELAIAKELSEHRKRVQRQRLIDERLLPLSKRYTPYV
jgi:hypothetical protein